MEPTGFDTVVFTFIPLDQLIRSLLPKLRILWPTLLVDIESYDTEKDYHDLDSDEACVSTVVGEGYSILYFFREAEMRDFLLDQGYVVGPDNEGPFAIHVGIRRNIRFQFSGMVEPKDSLGISKIPYGGWLCTPQILEITAVTPGDPDTNPFSRSIVDILLDSCK